MVARLRATHAAGSGTTSGTARDGVKSQRDWRSTMDRYVLPHLGKMHVGAVATSDVKRVLRPLALTGKHATTRMVAGRIEAVLEGAAGY